MSTVRKGAAVNNLSAWGDHSTVPAVSFAMRADQEGGVSQAREDMLMKRLFGVVVATLLMSAAITASWATETTLRIFPTGHDGPGRQAIDQH